MTKKTKKESSADEVQLLPLSEFQEVARRILSNSKEDSDKQLADFQLTNHHYKSIRARERKVIEKKPE